MAVNVKIKDLAPGAFFDIGPAKALILEHFTNGKTLLVTQEPIGDRPFAVVPFNYRRQDDKNPNDFSCSSIRNDLNTDFLSAVAAGGVIPIDRIADTAWDLSDHLGGAGYGTVTCQIGLLTPDQYVKYINAGLLPEDCWDGWEWTITPSAGSASDVRYVNSGGSLGSNYARDGSDGVRPAFFVDSEILLSLEEDEVDLADSAILAAFTSRQLVEEVLRRIAAGETDDTNEGGDDIW
jgi:hypothetical protein